MNYCPQCAAPLEERVPDGDDRPRMVCPGCGAIHYKNPINVVGAVVERGDEVLLCRRAIEPARGLWTVPAGFLELGEGLRDGARRETFEEACARIDITAPQSQIDLPHIGQVYSIYRATLAAPEYGAGDESLEVEFFAFDRIPWKELAFPVIHFALRLYVEDRVRGDQHFHLGVLRWTGEGSRFDAARYELEDHARVPIV